MAGSLGLFLEMETIIFVSLLLSASHVSSQSSATEDTDFSCSSESPPCETFLTYRAKSPDYLSLGPISDLFGVSRLSIAKASELVSEDAQLVPDQILLVPVRCSCNGSVSFYNVTYQIKKDDTFYSVSIHDFENLTNYHLVENMNSELNPVNLTIGAEVVFPLLCKCPTQSNLNNGFQYLITYVWQPGDDIFPVSALFNTTPLAVAEENNYRNFSSAICLPVLIPVQRPLLLQSLILPSSGNESNSNSKHERILAPVLSVGLLMVLSVILGFLAYFNLSSKFKKALLRSCSCSTLEKNVLIPVKKTGKDETFAHKTTYQDKDKILSGVSGYLGKPIVYDIKTIMEATGNLSEDSKIGGSVYLALINDQYFAVKKTSSQELKVLQKVNHSNLMKLMGMSSDYEKNNLFLVFEYTENGSLDKWLFPNLTSSSSSELFLTWSQRLYVALDVANGLQYMHEHVQPSIVHRDIRSTNILLDSSFKAKIANFSLARHTTNSLVLKVDVFGFGVLLLELLSGKKSSMEMMNNGEIIMPWKEIRGILELEEKKEERLRKWMDPRLDNFYPLDGALSLATLASACTSEQSSERPKMAEIVFSLCVLAQSYTEMCERFWTSGEADESTTQIVSPVLAR